MAALPLAAQSAALVQIAKEVPHYSAYQPLDPAKREIRLLTIEDESLYCSLKHASLDQRPDYIALSYYWGAPGVIKPIVLGGETLHVRKTLYHFLKSRFRHLGVVTVWLDVLCIDQSSVSEQSSQVSIMGDIYKQASCVYAWLGRGDADTDFALASVRRTENDGIDPDDERYVQAGFQTLSLQRYWTRVWVVQECLLNVQVMLLCGAETAMFDKFLAACLRPKSEIDKLFGDSMQERLREFQLGRSPSERSHSQLLLSVVHRFAQHECKDQRDKIYGLRALAIDGHQLHVDYTKQIMDVALEVLSLDNWTCFLLQCDEHAQRLAGSNAAIGIGTASAEKWWMFGGSGFSISDGVTFICGRLQIKDDEIFRSLAPCQDDWLVIPVVPWHGSRYYHEVASSMEESAQWGTPYEDVVALWRKWSVPRSACYAAIKTAAIYSGHEDGDAHFAVGGEPGSGEVRSAHVDVDIAVSFPAMEAKKAAGEEAGSYDPGGQAEYDRNPFSRDRERQRKKLYDRAEREENHLKAWLSPREDFQAIWRRNIWTCHITQAIHVSRFFLFMLHAFEGARSTWDYLIVRPDFLEYARRHRPLLTPHCTCVLPEGVSSRCPPPWRRTKPEETTAIAVGEWFRPVPQPLKLLSSKRSKLQSVLMLRGPELSSAEA